MAFHNQIQEMDRLHGNCLSWTSTAASSLSCFWGDVVERNVYITKGHVYAEY